MTEDQQQKADRLRRAAHYAIDHAIGTITGLRPDMVDDRNVLQRVLKLAADVVIPEGLRS